MQPNRRRPTSVSTWHAGPGRSWRRLRRGCAAPPGSIRPKPCWSLPAPRERFFQVPAEREALIASAFPANDDRALLRRLIDDAVEGDLMGLNAYRDGATVRFAYPAVILSGKV